LRATNHQATRPPQRETPLRSTSVRDPTSMHGTRTLNVHVSVKQPNWFCDLDASTCSTTVSTCGIAHGVLLLLAGHKSVRLSPRKSNDAFDIIPSTTLPHPRIFSLESVTRYRTARHNKQPRQRTLKPQPSRTSWPERTDAITYWLSS
jgi:hypothetical protein